MFFRKKTPHVTSVSLFLRRKIMLAVTAVVDVYGLFLVLDNFAYMMSMQHIVTNLITNQVATIIFVLTVGGCWLYAKLTRKVPDALMDVWLLGMNLSIILMVVGSTGYPWVPMFQTFATAAVACNTRWLRYHLAVSVVGMFLVQYNQAMEPFGKLLLVVPGDAFVVSFFTVIMRHITASIAFAAGVLVVSSNSIEFHKKSLAATAAIEMSLEVSQKLALYDTDGARAVLAAYASRDQGNVALMTCFGTIVMNLEQYRQHLPNYVLYPEGDEDDPSSPKRGGGTGHSARAIRGRRGTEHSSARARPVEPKGRPSVRVDDLFLDKLHRRSGSLPAGRSRR